MQALGFTSSLKKELNLFSLPFQSGNFDFAKACIDCRHDQLFLFRSLVLFQVLQSIRNVMFKGLF